MISQANQIARVSAESHIDSIMAPVKTTVDLPDDLMRVQLPLIRCAHPARIEEEMTPSRVAELLMDDEGVQTRLL